MEALRPDERIDDLQYRGLKIIQDSGKFCFGLDAVLLAGFAAARAGDHICDLGTGNGILSLLLCGRLVKANIDAVEVSPDFAALAERNARLNHLENRINIYNKDLTEVRSFLPAGRHDLVVSNPPYFKMANGPGCLRPKNALARVDESCTIEEVSNAAGWLLRNGGKLAVVFPAARMLDLMDAMRAARIEPKRFRLVSTYIGKAPYICLVEGVKGANSALHPLSPLILYEADGSYTAELREIYHMDGSETGKVPVGQLVKEKTD